jgi:SAM-dependent methyltransferase
MTNVSYRQFTGSAAENYERFFVPAIATPVSAIMLERAALQPGEHVLDVACGTGVLARRASELVGPTGSVAGIDVAPDMIGVAKAVSPALDWRVGDAASLPFPDAGFDVVTCQMGLMFMEDRAKPVAEMRRVVVPGGRVVITTPGEIQPIFEAMECAITDHVGPDLGGFVRAVFSMYDPDAVGALLAGAGLRDVRADLAVATCTLPLPAEFLWEYVNLTPLAPIVAAAPTDAQEAMERQFVASAAPFVTDGRILVDQPMVIASGIA